NVRRAATEISRRDIERRGERQILPNRRRGIAVQLGRPLQQPALASPGNPGIARHIPSDAQAWDRLATGRARTHIGDTERERCIRGQKKTVQPHSGFSHQDIYNVQSGSGDRYLSWWRVGVIRPAKQVEVNRVTAPVVNAIANPPAEFVLTDAIDGHVTGIPRAVINSSAPPSPYIVSPGDR